MSLAAFISCASNPLLRVQSAGYDLLSRDTFQPFAVRFVFDQHDLPPELYQARYKSRGVLYRLIRWAERCSSRAADVAIACHETCRETALARGKVPPANGFVVRSCPDLSDFNPRLPDPSLRHNFEHLVAYLGVMGLQDGCELLIESVDCLVSRMQRRDTLFVLIGYGSK